MKIIAILGSPKKKGNTATVLSMFKEKLKENHELEIVNISKYNIGGCLGCFKCQEKPDVPGCIQKDDAAIIFRKLIEADAIVYATPLYCWSFTAQIKPLIDRHVCLVSGYGTPEHSSLVEGKAAALLVTCGGPNEGNCDAIKSISKGFCEYGKLDFKGNFILPFCTAPDKIGEYGEKLADKLAKEITVK